MCHWPYLNIAIAAQTIAAFKNHIGTKLAFFLYPPLVSLQILEFSVSEQEKDLTEVKRTVFSFM